MKIQPIKSGLLVFAVGLGLVAGCTTPMKQVADADAIQGTWSGQEVGNGQAALSWLTISGNELEFRGVNRNEWYKGTFTLRENARPKEFIAVIQHSPLTQYVGKTAMAIYTLEQGRLIISGNEPGNPEAPADFNVHTARQIVFTRLPGDR